MSVTTSAQPTFERVAYCDRCGGQIRAVVRFQLPSGGTLTFCGHHTRELETSLIEAGATRSLLDAA